MRGGVRYWGNGINSMNDIFMICWSLLIYLVFSSRAFRVVIFLTIANVYPTSKKWLFGPPEKKPQSQSSLIQSPFLLVNQHPAFLLVKNHVKLGAEVPDLVNKHISGGETMDFFGYVSLPGSPGLTRPQPGLSGLRQNTPWREIPKMLWQDGPVWREYFGEPYCWDISKSFQVNLDPYSP